MPVSESRLNAMWALGFAKAEPDSTIRIRKVTEATENLIEVIGKEWGLPLN